jgi:acetyltransferase-like isoleucine patch superfamily enzyme
MKVFAKDVAERIAFWKSVDRIGPDTPWTYWRLFFKSTMRDICSKKFLLFGEKAEFRPGAYAVTCSKIQLGARVVIRPGTMLFADPRPNGAGIVIEDNVMLGSGVHIYVSNHMFEDVATPIIDQGHSLSEPVVLHNGCWIGANSIILAGVHIGENAVVGAGSVVTKSIPPRVLAVGNPARVLRKISPSEN